METPLVHSGPVDLDLETTTRGRARVLTVRGEIDSHTAPRLRQAVLDLADEREPRIIVDLERVEVLDPTCLGALAGGVQRVEANRGMMTVVVTKPEVLRYFEHAGLNEVLGIVGSLDEATSRMESHPADRAG